MNRVDERTQILFEIDITIGGDLDFDRMLRNVSITTLRKLNGIAYVVFAESEEQGQHSFELSYATPQNFTKSDRYSELSELIVRSFDAGSLDKFYSRLPLAMTLQNGDVLHLMELPNFGLLALFRAHGFLSDSLIYSLAPLNKKLAVACQACLFHEGLERQVRKRTAELENANLRLRNEISERKLAVEELIESQRKLMIAKDQAEAANRAKSEFLSRMSHELRTPLHAVMGFSQLLDQYFDETFPAKIRLCTQQIAKAGKHLLVLIDDLLDVVKIEQNKIEMKLEAIDLNLAVEESLAIVGEFAKENNITLLYGGTNFFVIADFMRLKQVLINLLTNAIKYNCDRGKVSIRVENCRFNQIEITVQDTGVGIEPNEQAQVFEPFYRTEYAYQNELDGVGIGLALTKTIIQKMNGEIGLKSSRKGTAFWLRLPMCAVNKIAAADRQLLDADVEPCTVLYVENNLSCRKLFQMIIEGQPNITLVTADHAEQGIIIAAKLCPDLIFLDINLPGMNGIEALKKMRNYSELKNTRIVALSADALPTQIDAALDAGFDQYLVKPIDIDDVVAELLKIKTADA